jgi:hypothetical protein
MTADNKEEDFAVLLESLCRNGRGAEVIELLTEWLSTELGKCENLSRNVYEAKIYVPVNEKLNGYQDF